jgi:hypothetical protein
VREDVVEHARERHAGEDGGRVRLPHHRVVALQVEFERQSLKPVFHIIGFRLWV